mgnify:CR=1 FL=1
MSILKIGDIAPSFRLLNVDGKYYSLEDFKSNKILVVIFTCNHCPTAQAYEKRIIEIARDFTDKGVKIVVINSNDDESFPEDSYENMITRYDEKCFNFPYLRDDDQTVALSYLPLVTPDIFVFDEYRRLRYRGAIDDNRWEDTNVKLRYLREVIENLLNGKNPKYSEIQAVGCGIKWKNELSDRVQKLLS